MAVPATLPGAPGMPGVGQATPGGLRDGDGGQSRGTAGAGDYSLDTLPGGLGDGSAGPMTAQERAAVLTGTLNSGYEEFDGLIIAERARAQAEANAARNTGIPGDSGGSGSGAGGGGEPVIVAARPAGGMPGPQGAGAGSSGTSQEQTFPPPEDIPSGRDDDIVARQIREAAMREADPELREKLWDEYRRYTGTGG